MPTRFARAQINSNQNWKFICEDVARVEAGNLYVLHWTTIGKPHSFSDVDLFRNIIFNVCGLW